MTDRSDPFDRAVERERVLRHRAAVFDSPARMMKVVRLIHLGLAAGWGLVLAGHWAAFGDPRWLAVLHTVVFVLAIGGWTFAYLFITWMRRRRPDMFEDDVE